MDLSPPTRSMREPVQTAYEKLKQYQQKARLQNSAARNDSKNGEGTVRLSTAHDEAPPNVRVFVKIDHQHYDRGVGNAMQCLIENHGLDNLRQCGVICSCDGSYSQRLYAKEIARVAKTYKIKTYVLIPANAASNGAEHLRAHGITMEFISEHDFRSDYILASTIARIGAFRFPSHDEPDVIHGQGTVALELEEGVEQLLQAESPALETNISNEGRRLDAIINVMGNGSTLCGICMATQGTATRVFGAETMSTFASEDDQMGREGSRHYTENFKPMGALPWSVFTSPNRLSSVFYVDQKMAEMASKKFSQQHGVRVRPYDAAPLGVVLFSEDFRRFAEQEAQNGRVRNIGVILRPDLPGPEDGSGGTCSDAELEHFFRSWRV